MTTTKLERADNGGYDAAREIAHLYPRAVLLRDRRIVAENALGKKAA